MMQVESECEVDGNVDASDGHVQLQMLASVRKTAGVFVRISANQRRKNSSARNKTVGTRKLKSQLLLRLFFASLALLVFL